MSIKTSRSFFAFIRRLKPSAMRLLRPFGPSTLRPFDRLRDRGVSKRQCGGCERIAALPASLAMTEWWNRELRAEAFEMTDGGFDPDGL